MFFHFSWVDFTILAIITASALMGAIRGFVREAFSLVTWILAFVLSFTYCDRLAEVFSKAIARASLRYWISFLIIFVVVLIIGAVINFLIAKLIKNAGLGLGDRILGFLFGIARGILLISLILMLGTASSLTHSAGWHNAQLIPYFKPLIAWGDKLLPNSVAAYFAPGGL